MTCNWYVEMHAFYAQDPNILLGSHPAIWLFHPLWKRQVARLGPDYVSLFLNWVFVIASRMKFSLGTKSIWLSSLHILLFWYLLLHFVASNINILIEGSSQKQVFLLLSGFLILYILCNKSREVMCCSGFFWSENTGHFFVWCHIFTICGDSYIGPQLPPILNTGSCQPWCSLQCSSIPEWIVFTFPDLISWFNSHLDVNIISSESTLVAM